MGKTLDYLRVTLVLVGAIGQFAAGFLPDLLEWEQTIASRSDVFNTALIPSGWAFLIWPPLFLGMIGFAIYHAMPSQISVPLMRRVGWWVALATIANAVRSLYEPVFGPNWISFALLELIWLPLIIAALDIVKSRPHSWERQLGFWPVIGQGGWITVASAAGFSQTALFTSFSPYIQLGELNSSLVILTVWLPIALAIVWRLKSSAYVFAVCWGLYWVSAKHIGQDTALLAYASYLFIAVFIIATWLSARLSGADAEAT